MDSTTSPQRDSESLNIRVSEENKLIPLTDGIEFAPKDDCSICSGKSYITGVPVAKMATLKEHIFSVHFPWYLTLSQYKLSADQQTTLSQRLHPALCCAYGRKWKKPPSVISHMWGKLLHGLLQYLSTLLSIGETCDLLKHVNNNKLYLSKKCNLTDPRVKMSHDERMMFKAHLTYLQNTNRHVGFRPPNCISGVLHWITLTNILCSLPVSERLSVVTYEKFTTDNVYKPPEPHLMFPAAKCATILWRSIESNDVKKLLDVIAAQAGVLKMVNPDSGFGPINQALSRKQYLMASALLFAGGNVEEKDNKGWTALCRAVFRGDLRAVDILLAWGASKQLDKAYKIAKGEKYTAITTAIVTCLKTTIKVTDPGRELQKIKVTKADVHMRN